MRRPSFLPLVRRGWMVLVTLVVVGVATFGVYRLHGIFGSGDPTSTSSDSADEIVPFNPKDVVYEVFGAPGATATINYLDVNAAPQQVIDAPLPWRYQATTTEPAVIADLRAQGNGATLGCHIFIDGELKDERIVNAVSAYTFCLDKSG
ncbi:MmpS family transport accessory protein [[Mycobacterium] vasticus]|uniref:MmpS family transport accessory protein n=1 Tax=[Mycobacterium] vasticus TaxID=2875777 RepID=A0ABU5Z250_9MYCO|nr:MmpS family transport accessory protein [Mycolicibacter sp. MYC017]MEB3071466.1 MmpS family transport accessory protein [Mycolicibacter sp. MYC017]